MEEPWSYYEDEVRDGFFVPSIMKKCWAYNKKLYDDFLALCDRQNLRCTGDYGAILGAVRHGGFIPWDDDIDVEMPREDYVRLLRASEKEQNKDYSLFDYARQKDEDPNLVRRFVNCEGYVAATQEELDRHHGFPFGSALDVFVHDYVPKNVRDRKDFKNILDTFYSMHIYALEPEKIPKGKNFEHELKILEKKFHVRFTSSLPVAMQLLEMMERLCADYSMRECDGRVILHDWYEHPKHIFSKKAWDGWIEVPFEGETMRIPIGYDHILRRLYPNYMAPKVEWDNHNYPFFDFLEKKAWEDFGMKLLRYEYDKAAVEEKKKKRSPKTTLVESMEDSLELLAQAHQFIEENIDLGEQISSIPDLLGQCQTLAIQMGEQIEESGTGASNDCIELLEKYCDFIFGIYQKLCDNLQKQVLESREFYELQQFGEYETALREKIGKLSQKREVVFLVYQSRHWKTLHSLWEEAAKDENTQVTVIPIPYFYRRHEGNLQTVQQLETKGYPEEVPLTSYEEYNFEAHHPDVIVYQCPYDEYNYALSVHPFFYASNLRQYTEKMVFIPPFVLREIVDKDERAKYTLRWFVHTPGLIFADEIYVQSEQMRKIYAELLSELTKEKIETWRDKIYACGSPLWDWQSRKNEKENEKKVILYYVSGSVLYEYEEQMIEKMQQFFQLAKQYKNDILIVWKPDPYAKEILSGRAPQIWEKYNELLSRFEREEIGVVACEEDDRNLVEFCDGIYGDGGTLMNECRMNHKMVLFETPNVPLISTGKEENSYQSKRWMDDTLVAIEGEWTFDSFVQEISRYQYQVPKKDCGKTIWNQIFQK